MTPREQLERELTIILHGMCRDRHGAAKAISENLNNYAIGRWVSVEERLPEFHDDRWKGVTIGAVGNVQFGRHYIGLPAGTTHWLELDMPKQPNEKGE